MLVSVIIPCFNVSLYIEECLSSVYAQVYPSLEVICVDNNSSDGTLELLQRIKSCAYPDLMVLSETSGGASFARNKGLMAAKGEWVQFLDADDLLEVDKIAHQVSIVHNKSVAFVAGASRRRDVNGNERSDSPTGEQKFVSAFTRKCGITSSNLWNRKLLLSVGGWNVSLKSSQETDLMFRLLLNGFDYVVDSEAKTIIRERPEGQISQSDPKIRWSRFIDVRFNYLDQLEIKYPEVYAANKSIFLNYLMTVVLILLKYEESVAISYYRRVKEYGWYPFSLYGLNKLRGYFIYFLGLKSYSRLLKCINWVR